MRTQDFLGPIFNGDHEERRKVVIHSLRTIGIVLAPVRALTEIVLYIPLKAWNFLASSTTIGPYAAKVSYLVDAPSLYFRSPTFRRLGGGRYYRWYSNIMWSTSIVWEAPIFAYKYLL
jgi:protein kinase C substrate 80K-H